MGLRLGLGFVVEGRHRLAPRVQEALELVLVAAPVVLGVDGLHREGAEAAAEDEALLGGRGRGRVEVGARLRARAGVRAWARGRG